MYTAPTESAALEGFAEFSEVWEARYPAIVKLWENAWAEFEPFLSFDEEIRSVIYTTNTMESLKSRFRRSINAVGAGKGGRTGEIGSQRFRHRARRTYHPQPEVIN